jgi:ABC-type transporter Mla subunit MlaD
MRRIVTGTLVSAALIAGVIFGVAAKDGSAVGYEVRAIFDDVASAVPGEEVRVAGAKVGSIGDMVVTADNKAAVVLKIEDAGFAPFHADAHCTIRPQSLIGEKYVECRPGSPSAPELSKIRDGQPGAGQHLLPLKQTSAPVDIDLINNVLRLPYRQRFSIVLTELGAAFAGRGQDLNALIRRANPALRETDRVLKLLADENTTLARLAENSDVALAPLARDRKRLSGFIRHANTVGEATAERRTAIEASIARLPRFLRELKPTMQDLGALSAEMTPVLTDLGAAAPSLGRFVLELGPFSRSANVSLTSLGKATDVGGPVLQRAQPVVNDLKNFAQTANPVSKNLDDLTASLDKTGGIEQFMNYIFFQMTAINGFDSLGHYLRAGLLVNVCSTYVTTQQPGCAATFRTPTSVTSAATAAKAAGKGGKAAAKAKKTPSQALGGVLKGLLDLTRRRQAGSLKTNSAATHVQQSAARGGSAALDGVGGRDAALLQYLMADG